MPSSPFFHPSMTPPCGPTTTGSGSRPGVRLEEAETQLRRLAVARDTAAADLRLVPIRTAYLARLRPILAALGGAVLLVLGIAFGNAASLVLVRATGRESEFALRSAMGAGASRLGRQLLVEGVWLSGLASVAGLLLASPDGPLGSALMGAKVGDTVTYQAPGGAFSVTITATSPYRD